MTVQPDEEDPAWYVSVALLGDGRYEVERCDVHWRERQVTTETHRGTIARELTIWMAARDFPGRPTRANPDF